MIFTYWNLKYFLMNFNILAQHPQFCAIVYDELCAGSSTRRRSCDITVQYTD